MTEKNVLTEKFEANRMHLRAVAYRMLGSRTEAEDAVQEAWLRLNRADTRDVKNLGGWLTTVTARICLDMLRTRKSRREEPITPLTPEPAVNLESMAHEAQLADSVGAALLVVLETLAPPERLAFVLHDMFAVPFDDIAPIVGRTPDATRQLASRARRRVQGKENVVEKDLTRHRKIVDAFLKASREGNFEELLEVLDPDVVFRPDPVAAKMGNQGEARGAQTVAALFKGRAQAAKPAVADGAMAVAVILGGQLRIVLGLTFNGDRISGIEAIADIERIRGLDVTFLNT